MCLAPARDSSVLGRRETGRVLSKQGANLLLITLDTVRADRVGVYDRRFVRTPHIDALAGRSFVFVRAFSHNPVTLPAHVNILTGTFPPFHGIGDNAGFRLGSEFLTLAEHLKGLGYATAAFVGAFPLDSRFGLDQGFDVYDDGYGTHNALDMFFAERRAEDVVGPAGDWIARQKGPWFAWVHLFDAHQPYAPPPPFDRSYARDPYSGEVAYVDACLGRLFNRLTAGKAGEPVVVLTADHGEALGEKGEQTHSYFAYNNTIRVPLLIRIPGAAGRTVSDNVCHADIFPTVCEALGLPVPASVQGLSLWPLFRDGTLPRRDIYFESLTAYLNRGWAPLRGFIRGSLKYIDLPVREVYDLEADMAEARNLASAQDTAALAADLKRLTRMLRGPRPETRTAGLSSLERSRLASLGYIASASTGTQDVFGPQDDLKTLLPLQNRMLEAVGLVQSGRIEEAIRSLRSVIAENPGFQTCYTHLASILKDRGRLEEAVVILSSGAAANPRSLPLRAQLGIMLAEAGRAEEAVRILEDCVSANEEDPEIWNYLGVAYYKMGDFERALMNYRKSLGLDRNYASVYNNIGSLYLSRFLKTKAAADMDEALESLSRALEIDPRLAAAWNSRGAARRFQGDARQAVSDWKQAVIVKPDFIDPYFNLGILYLEAGDKAAALEWLGRIRDTFWERLPAKEQGRLARLLEEARR